VNSPTRSYLRRRDPIAFFIRPEYVRLVRKDRGAPDPHHMNMMRGRIVARRTSAPCDAAARLDTPGEPAQGDFDLEVEVPHLVYEILDIERDATGSSRSTAARSTCCRPDEAGVIALRDIGVRYGGADVLEVPRSSSSRARSSR